MFDEIHGHRLAEVSRLTPAGPGVSVRVCLRCGAHFADTSEAARTRCSRGGSPQEHDLVRDPEDGLLYCTRCPLVAYDHADAASEPDCPMPLQFGS
ncbi:hypothetical protein ACI2LF_35795 [Kribbella sp. NPDC020789]